MKTKLCLGAGKDPRLGEEWINLDIVEGLPNIQVIHNLVFIPYPFEDEMFEFIECKDALEHLPAYSPDWKPMIPAFIEEMYRLLKPNGMLWIQTPGHKAAFAWSDPTHTRTFTKDSMSFFDDQSEFGVASGFISTAKFRVKSTELENGNLIFEMTKI